jgi:hypothetical protein
MKVKCINNKGYEYRLTIGKWYNVIRNHQYYGFLIIDDKNYEFWFSKKYFKSLSEIRNNKIDKLLS